MILIVSYHVLQYAPLLFIALYSFGALINVSGTSQVLLAVYGFVMSWVYLRFYQRKDGVKGDSSDTFTFESFFPDPLQYVCASRNLT